MNDAPTAGDSASLRVSPLLAPLVGVIVVEWLPSLAELPLVEEDCKPPAELGRNVSEVVVLSVEDAVVLAVSSVFKFGAEVR